MSLTKNHNIKAFKALDSLRGLAALYVLIHHARSTFTQPYYQGFLTHPEEYNLLNKLFVYFFSVFKFGHAAVILFFVLSGFFIHLKQAKGLTNIHTEGSRFNILEYLKKRILRIYPTLLCSFILSIVLDFAFSTYFNNWKNFNNVYTWHSFWTNLLLIPDSGAWGLNFATWSLKHEWFFYLIYPLLYLLTKISRILPVLFTLILFIFYFNGVRIPYLGEAVSTLIVWWLGAFMAEVYTGNSFVKITQIKLLIPIAALLMLSPLSGNTLINNIILGLLFVGFMGSILDPTINLTTRFLLPFSVIGQYSFSIYLFHYPIFHFIKNVFTNKIATEMPYHYGLVIFSIIFSLPIIYLLFLVGERPFVKLKNKI